MLTVVGDGFLGFRLLACVHGSAAYKAVIPALISTGLLLTLHYTYELPNSIEEGRWFGHPYPLASVVVAFTFLLTFKVSAIMAFFRDAEYRVIGALPILCFRITNKKFVPKQYRLSHVKCSFSYNRVSTRCIFPQSLMLIVVPY